MPAGRGVPVFLGLCQLDLASLSPVRAWGACLAAWRSLSGQGAKRPPGAAVHFDSRRGTLTVRTTLVELRDGRLLFGPPKTDAGMRTVTVPTAIRPDVRTHLKDFTGAAPDALIFTGVTGAVLRRSNFQRTAAWTVAVTAAGLPGFHFHDLRHTGNTLASRTGASLADLMARMGHSSTRAALIYHHTANERDRHIADALSEQITRQRDRARNGHAGERQRPT